MRLAVVLVCALLFVSPWCSAASQADSAVEITEAAFVVLTGLTVVPAQINEGASADISLSLENQGNIEAEVQANVTIKDASDAQVGIIVFDSFNMSPGETATLTSSWSAGTLPIGAYSANGLAIYDLAYTNALSANFSIVSPIQPTPTPNPVAPGGAAPTPTASPSPSVLPKPLPPAITPQYGGIVEFSKKIALKEVIAGTAGVETIELKNNAITPQAVSFDLSGAPTGFISTGANALMLEPGKGGTLTLAFSIPEDARAGDYLVKFTASNPGTRTVDYMVLRVKSIPEGHANPVTTKTIYIYSRTRTTEVRLSVVNPSSKKVERIQMFDQIPSDVATDPSQITFSEKVGVVVSSQPLELAWEFKDLQPGEHATVAYIVNNALEEYSPYAESTVRTATFSTERARGLLNIQEFNVPLMTLGKASSVTALLFYGGMDSAQVTVYLEAPLSGFSVKPERKQVLLAPRSVTRVSFEVTPTSSDAVGSGIVALVVSSDEFTLRQTALFIVKPLLGPDWQFLALAVAAVVVVAFILGRTILRRRRRTLERQFRKEAVEERDGYLKSVRDSILGNE